MLERGTEKGVRTEERGARERNRPEVRTEERKGRGAKRGTEKWVRTGERDREREVGRGGA